ncbi:MAG: Ku protein [Deltaproteobacteria bacterium]|nr:Ku protein [Deltaproteobacteria bacterium]
MPSRPIWSGAVSFGLVNVPVKLYSATSQKELRFHMLHDKDGGRIREKRVCENDGEEVSYDHIVKGYPLSKHQYVPVTREELAKFAPRSSRSIDIEDFVELSEIDPMYFDASYLLAPDEKAGRSYALLQRAMADAGRVGLAKVVLRTKQYLCALRPVGRALVLSTMHWADEVADPNDLPGLAEADATEPTARELEMAKKLVDGLATEFDPTKYRDDYRDKVLAMIERKAAGQELVVEEEAVKPAPSGSLADVLAASLAEVRSRSKGASEAKGERRHRPKAAARHKRKR